MKTELVSVLREISSSLKGIEAQLGDRKNGLAAIRMKLDMVTDDHDKALDLHAQRLHKLEAIALNGATGGE